MLHEVIDAEPPVDEMRPMLGTLAELGIEAGQPFRPSADTARLLALAAAQTRSEVAADQEKAALRSLFEDIAPDGADSVDPYFGLTEPDGAADRWIQTAPGQGWFCYFRIYGPQAAAFDGRWLPGDITAQV